MEMESGSGGRGWEWSGGLMVPGLGLVRLESGDWHSLPPALQSLVVARVALLRPRALWIVDGSEKEAQRLRRAYPGILHQLPRRPNTYIARTDPADVASMEGRVWTVTSDRAELTAPPTSLANYMDPEQADGEIRGRFSGAMRGRTMFLVPFSLGPIGDVHSLAGVELTDSPYAVLCLRLLARVSLDALWLDGAPVDFVSCTHSIGVPLPSVRGFPFGWECNPEATIIIHRPQEKEVWSFGSGYGGNAILTKTCLGLRLASCIAHELARDWMVAHMAVFSVTRLADGRKRWFGAAFPAGCGKTNLAMLKPSKPGWKVECLSDDIAWLRWNPDTGRLCARNPESGIFGVAPGTNADTNPVAMATLAGGAILTNVGLTRDGDPYWEGLEDDFPDPDTLITDWTGTTRPLRSASGGVFGGFAHPNARFAVPLSQCPTAAPEDPSEVPLDAIIFGSRRPTHYPLVYEASHLVATGGPQRHACTPWQRGVFIGASLRSEIPTGVPMGPPSPTAYANRALSPEPFAMRPYIGYNFGTFLRDWLALGEGEVMPGVSAIVPRVYHVNWFREDERTGLLLWPGFGENIRVLEWMMRRLDEGPGLNGLPTGTGQLRVLGVAPAPGSLDLRGLGLNEELLQEQTWVELGKDVAETLDWFKAEGGSEFPLSLALCGYHHIGIHADPARLLMWREGWDHLRDVVDGAALSPSQDMGLSAPSDSASDTEYANSLHHPSVSSADSVPA